MLDKQFLKRKKSVLSKSDKSSAGKWDAKIRKLCEKINGLNNYYTTSSCSGRAVVMIDQEKKAEDLFLKVYHNLLKFGQLRKDLTDIIKSKKYKNKQIKFKHEPCILHVACINLAEAQKLLDFAKSAGWKKSGIIASGKRFIAELNSTEKLEFPLVVNGKLFVNDDFLKVVIKDSNKKLKKSWGKIKRLEKLAK